MHINTSALRIKRLIETEYFCCFLEILIQKVERKKKKRENK